MRGTGRRVRGGAGARLPAPRALKLVKPDAADRMKRGSGWGNTPRPLVQLSAAVRLRAGEPHASCEASREACVLRGEPGGKRRGDGQRVLG